MMTIDVDRVAAGALGWDDAYVRLVELLALNVDRSQMPFLGFSRMLELF